MAACQYVFLFLTEYKDDFQCEKSTTCRLDMYRDQRVKQEHGEFSVLKHIEPSCPTDAVCSTIENYSTLTRSRLKFD